MSFIEFIDPKSFDPEAVHCMTVAFDGACKILGLTDTTDRTTELVAKKVIELAATGERDSARLRASVLAAFAN